MWRIHNFVVDIAKKTREKRVLNFVPNPGRPTCMFQGMNRNKTLYASFLNINKR